MKAIFTRRSIRRYTPEPVSAEAIREILKAAMSAPSAGNEQPWEFIVITDRSLLDEIPRFHPNAQMVKEASAAILVCGNLHRETHQGFWVQDCSAAVENILLAVTQKGLGAVWVGIYPRGERVEGMRKLFNLPDFVMPFALVPLGYPAEEKPPSERFDSSRIHDNKW
jgi:nitroreductase